MDRFHEKLSIKDIRSWIPRRKKTDNKSHGGRALIIAGSKKMPGAALLASKAANRVGAGYVYVSCREILPHLPEAIPWNKKNFEKISAVIIGPGLGVTKSTTQLLKRLKKTSLPIIVDADALTVAAKEKLYPFPPHWIATPHSGELARFFDVSAEQIESRRVEYIRKAQKKLGCIIVLKGFGTLISNGQDIVKIQSGNVALAKGGSGDALGGMMVGLLAQKVSPFHAAQLSCYIHGLIADNWIRDKNDYLSLTPSDIIEAIPKTLFKLRK